ncbi:hypothetical protein [Jiangella endophytica]|uniref:hypothetical protein n=1 Tax=Jiangella endophytica TaxID=1623398 RepID=UPI000E357D9D|nr:hypothetical protein [Jiangella endophytica]
MSGYQSLALFAGIVLAGFIALLAGSIMLASHLRSARRSGRREDFLTPAVFGHTAVAAFGGVVVLHFVTAFLLVPWFPRFDCPHPADFDGRMVFPLRAVCTQGTVVTDFVPGWVNPALSLLILVGVGATIAALGTARAGRESARVLRRRPAG